jgi:hypothetical protein
MNTGRKTISDAIESLATNIIPSGLLTREVPREAHSNWREEVHVVYCVGKGKFGNNADFKQRQFINLQMDMYDLSGRWVGYQLGVHESTSGLQDLLNPPPPPTGSWSEPSPVPELPFKEWTKGVWTFADGSAVYAVGQAYSQLVPLRDGRFMFMVTTGQVITNGTGRYEGAHGIKQATGTTLVPAGLLESGRFPAPGITFDAKTIEVFRIVKRQDLTEQYTGVMEVSF